MLGFIIGVIVGFVLSENWVKILAWIEKSVQTLLERKKKNSK